MEEAWISGEPRDDRGSGARSTLCLWMQAAILSTTCKPRTRWKPSRRVVGGGGGGRDDEEAMAVGGAVLVFVAIESMQGMPAAPA